MTTYRLRNIGIAVALALVAALLTTFYVSNYKQNVQKKEANTPVLVATGDIPAGMLGSEVVGKHLVAQREVARKAVVPGAVASPDKIRRLVALQPVYQGEQVTLRRFGPVAAQGIRAQLKGTLRAYQLAGDANQVMAGTVKAGDRVDLVANIKVSTSPDVFVSRIVLRDLKVLKVADAAVVGPKISGPGSNDNWVMLAIRDTQVQKLLWVTSNHIWHLQLRPVLKAADSPESIETLKTVVSDGVRPAQFTRGFSPIPSPISTTEGGRRR